MPRADLTASRPQRRTAVHLVPAQAVHLVPAQDENAPAGFRLLIVLGLVLVLVLGVAVALFVAFRSDVPLERAAAESGEEKPNEVKPNEVKPGLPLPGPATVVIVGGGGRYLIAHLPQQKQLAVFDATVAKFVRYLPVAEGHHLLAASRSVLFAARPEGRTLQRWSLTTFEALPEVPLPHHRIAALAIGYGCDGPLLIGVPAGVDSMAPYFYDPVTLARLDVKFDWKHLPSTDAANLARIHASADGRTFAMWSSRIGVYGAFLRENELLIRHEHDRDYPLLPSPDGRTIYGGHRIYTPELAVVADREVFDEGAMLPAASGPWFVQVVGVREGAPRPAKAPRLRTLHLGRSLTPIAAMPQLPELDDAFDPAFEDLTRLPLEMRLFLLPEWKLLVTLPETGDAFVVRSYDPEDSLRECGRDYLLVVSSPPTDFTPGKTLDYRLRAQSNKAGLTYSLEAGPDGMAIAADGRLTWPVPADFAAAEVDVIVRVSDAAGQEALQAFRLTRIPDGLARPDPVPPVPGRPNPVRPADLVGLPPLVPPGLKAARTVALPCPASDCVVGGGGRFLVMALPGVRQVAVLDMNEARIVKYLPLLDENALIAAGRTRLAVVYPGRRQIERWSLVSFEREMTRPVLAAGPVLEAVMGSASDGPLVLSVDDDKFRSKLHVVDLETLRPLPGALPQIHGGGGWGNWGGHLTRISPDGNLLAQWRFMHTPSGVSTANLITGQRFYEHDSAGYLVPGSDGQTLFTGTGLWSIQGKRLTGDALRGPATLPAAHGPGYLTLHQRDNMPITLGVCLLGHDLPLATLDPPAGLDLPREEPFQKPRSLSLDKRVSWVPGAKLLAILPLAGDRIVLHPFDLADYLTKSGQDYLVVMSRPEPRAVAGQTYSYALDVQSSKGSVQYKLSAGPPGMTVDTAGKVTWPVPAGFAAPAVEVTLTVRDAGAKELSHSFRVAVSK